MNVMNRFKFEERADRRWQQADQKKHDTLPLITTLDKCSQILREDRIWLRNQIKANNQELIGIFRSSKKPINMQHLQIKLRKYVNSIKNQHKMEQLMKFKENLNFTESVPKEYAYGQSNSIQYKSKENTSINSHNRKTTLENNAYDRWRSKSHEKQKFNANSFKNTFNSKDTTNCRDNRENRENRDSRENRENREIRDNRDNYKDTANFKDTANYKDIATYKDNVNCRDSSNNWSHQQPWSHTEKTRNPVYEPIEEITERDSENITGRKEEDPFNRFGFKLDHNSPPFPARREPNPLASDDSGNKHHQVNERPTYEQEDRYQPSDNLDKNNSEEEDDQWLENQPNESESNSNFSSNAHEESLHSFQGYSHEKNDEASSAQKEIFEKTNKLNFGGEGRPFILPSNNDFQVNSSYQIPESFKESAIQRVNLADESLFTPVDLLNECRNFLKHKHETGEKDRQNKPFIFQEESHDNSNNISRDIGESFEQRNLANTFKEMEMDKKEVIPAKMSFDYESSCQQSVNFEKIEKEQFPEHYRYFETFASSANKVKASSEKVEEVIEWEGDFDCCEIMDVIIRENNMSPFLTSNKLQQIISETFSSKQRSFLLNVVLCCWIEYPSEQIITLIDVGATISDYAIKELEINPFAQCPVNDIQALLDIEHKGYITKGDIEDFLAQLREAEVENLSEIAYNLEEIFEAADVKKEEKLNFWSLYLIKDTQFFEDACQLLGEFEFQIET